MNDKKHITYQKLNDLISISKCILLSTHVNPDGDGLGCEIAFYHYLKKRNIECRIINSSSTPKSLSFLESDPIIEIYNNSMDEWIDQCDLAISFDIGDYNRMMELGERLKGRVPVVCFDHHPQEDESNYSHIILDIKSPATGYMAWKYFQKNYPNKLLSKNIATPLYVALITDTGSFKYECTSSDTHLMAAHLIESGVDNYEIHKKIYENKPKARVRILGKAINSLQYTLDNKVAWVEITEEILKECNASFDDTEGLGDFIRSIKGVEVSVVLTEREENKIKITFRSNGYFIVNTIAKKFGGGGHKFASGALTDIGSMNLIMEKILIDIKEQMKR